MTPVHFPEVNITFESPTDLPGSCSPIQGYMGVVQGGVFDGSAHIVVAWHPSPEDLEKINAGHPVFLSVIGHLPPHFLCMSFGEAVNV